MAESFCRIASRHASHDVAIGPDAPGDPDGPTLPGRRSRHRPEAYARPRFDTGTGWTYHPTERVIHVAGDAAWFEERLQHAAYGETRGTGVVLRTDQGWRVAQYNLTLPIPNELFRDIAGNIADYYAGHGDQDHP